MSRIDNLVSDLKFSRTALLKAIEGLSVRELTLIKLSPSRTIRDILVHIMDWNEQALQSLPLLLNNQGENIPLIGRKVYNQQLLEQWQDKSISEILTALQTQHQKLLTMIASLDQIDFDMRREHQGQHITIRSYIITLIIEHDRDHAVEIEQWRKNMEDIINYEAIKTTLAKNRAEFMALVESMSEADLIKKGVVERWSVKDVITHIANWERILLQTAEHLYDPSQPPVTLLSQNIDEVNLMVVAQRDMKPLSIELRYLRSQQTYWDEFIAQLKPKDWLLRGAYPWGGDGTIAELIQIVAEHYANHFPQIKTWQNKLAET